MSIRRISVIGLGYMGLPMAALLAQAGFSVTGVDIDAKRVQMLREGKVPFDEPGFPELFKQSFSRLVFSRKPVPSDAFIIAVPTPITKRRTIDLTFVTAAVHSLAPVLRNGNLVVIESTVGPGSCAAAVKPILDRTGKRYLLAYCPERAFPGKTLYEMVHNDRIVGGMSATSSEAARGLYKKFVKGNIFVTDIETAETVKVLENSYRDVNIAFANEVARMAHTIGIDIWEVIRLANRHPRVDIMQPGPGVGGHCIPIDPWFLVEKGKKDAKLIRRSLLVNEGMPHFVVDLMERAARKYKLKPKNIAILGVAYKKNVDDTRETPAERIIERLHELRYSVRCADPLVKHFYEPLFGAKEALAWADAAILVTDHDAFRKLSFTHPKLKLVVDTRNALTEGQRKQLRRKKVVTLGKGVQ